MDDYNMNYIPDSFDRDTFVEVSNYSKHWNTPLKEMNLDKCIFEFPDDNKEWPSSKTFRIEDLNIGSHCIILMEGKFCHGCVIGKNHGVLLCHPVGFELRQHEHLNEWKKTERKRV
eukprot:UN08694